jgi:large subunit ribosomal protein L21
VSELQQAIIRTGGKQYRVSPGSVLKVEKLPVDKGAKVELEVLLVGQGEAVKIGTPLVAGAKVEAEVVSHGRGPKLIVYKFRKRSNYRKKQGHRQAYTELKITGISG